MKRKSRQPVSPALLKKIAQNIEKGLGEGALRKIKETEYLSTGIKSIDWALGGGVPIGKMTEVFGKFSTGKTLLGEHLVAETQRIGGIGIFVDGEHRFSVDMARAVKIDTEALFYLCPNCLEESYDYMVSTATSAREQFPGPVALVWDCLGGTQAREEMEGEVTLQRRRGLRAQINSIGLAKIIPLMDNLGIAFFVTNQLRDKPNVMYGRTWYSQGGNAPEFYSTIQVLMKKRKEIRIDAEGKRLNDPKKKGKVIGQAGNLIVVKNSVAPPFREVDFETFFDRGIPALSGWLDCLVEQGEIIKEGGWYHFQDSKEKFYAKDFEEIWEKGGLKDGDNATE